LERMKLILVGGFLGAGKTTLMATAARRLLQSGDKVGLITNDQAASLVDTAVLEKEAPGIAEVSGGCLCCRFGELISSLKRLLAEISPDVVIGEPVGSCTDISATVLQPLKKLYGEMIDVAPLTVLADPNRLAEILDPDRSRGGGALDESVSYIYLKQLEEADIIAVNKADLMQPPELDTLEKSAAERFPDTEVLSLSALDGRGVDEWLRLVTSGRAAGARIAEVDYDTYAEGEAMLGWLNAAVKLEADAGSGADWREFTLELVESIRSACRDRGAEIAHVKVLLKSGGGSLAANITTSEGAISLRGEIASVPAPNSAELIVNARVQMPPGELEEIVQASLLEAATGRVRLEIEEMSSFSPARPEPTHRYGSVV